jgi:glycerol-1-phosphate dehydrogenase [NAD(P)+]
VAMQLDRAAIDDALGKASTTKHLVLEPGAIDRVGEIIANAWPGVPVLIVADDVTWHLAGSAVQASLAAAGQPLLPPVRLQGEPIVKPDMPRTATIRQAIEQAGTPVLPLAVGSGTINDLTKRASFEAGVPYAVFGTAASMDGYTASGAAMIVDGVKQTLACDAPAMVIADRDILAAAPGPMTASGYGDLLGKVTAGADWLIADALGIEPIVQHGWDAVQGPLRGILADSARYATGDPVAIEQLFLALAGSGLAIQATGSSRPASGSEHQFSHLWEMRGLELDGIPVSHGFKVGVGSIVSSALYERLLERDLSSIDPERLVRQRPSWTEVEAEVRRVHTNPAIVAKSLEETRAKYVTDEELRARLTALRDCWPELAIRLRRQLPPTGELRDLLAGAGCPTTPEQIGLDRDQLRGSYLAATHIRRRYTVYDLAHDTGIFADLVDEVFAPGGYWHG